MVLWISLAPSEFHIRDFHPLWLAFPKPFCYSSGHILRSLTPSCTHDGLGSFPFARRYSGNRVFFLFLRVLRCFSSPGSLPYVMDWRMDDRGLLCRVSPFRNLRIKGYLLLPEAYRSLSRLSSALSAKASTLRSFLLDLVYSFYSVRNWVFAFNNADRIASILNFRSFGLVVNFVYDILGCLDKKSFSSKSSV